MITSHSAPQTRHAGPFTAADAKAWRYGFLAAIFLCLSGFASLAGSPADVPSISAGLGTCSADFIVVDAAAKPIFDAKIQVKMKYGFMSKRGTDLQIGTNSDGKAHIEGLPNKLKKPPLEYIVQKDDLTKMVSNDPATECHPVFNLTLAK